MKLLVPLLMLCAAGASAQASVGCTPVAAAALSAEEFARDYEPRAKGKGAEVPVLAKDPLLTWDLGEKRKAKLGVYLTRECALGLRTYVTGGWDSASPDLQGAVDSLAGQLREHAPDWTFSVEPPNTMKLAKDGVELSTDFRKLVQARLDAATAVDLGGVPVRAIFDGWLLFLVPADASKAVNLSVRSTTHPWAYYDLTPYGLPRLLARFDDGKAVLFALP